MVDRRTALKWATAGAAVAAAPSFAQTYPAKPIKLVIGFTAGGAGDFIARSMGDFMSRALGQPVIVENRPGASGALAAGLVARAPADGYTLFLPSDGNTSIAVATLGAKLSYDPVKDFESISQLVSFPFVLVVNPDVPAKNLKELIALAKAKPRQLNYASWGLGSTGHLAAEVFCQQADVQIEHIAYKGSAAAVVDLRAGQVQMMFDTVASCGPHIKAGALRPIGLSANRRIPAFPDIPTLAESGLPDYDTSAFIGLMAPAGTPAAIVQTLARVAADYAASADVREKLSASGMVPVGSSSAQFRQMLIADTARYQKLVHDKGLKFE